jgi:CRP/FNR family transcriptional regulator, cyclic AMP receptor protein
MTESPTERLRRNPVFQVLCQHGRRRTLSRNQVVLAEGEAPRNLYLVLSGTVAVRLSNRHGREVLLAYMHTGDFFGEMCLFPDVSERSAMIQAVTGCCVLEIPYRTFIDLAARTPNLWLELAGQLAQRLRDTNRRLADIPVVSARDRVWSVLVELAQRSDPPRNGNALELRITREDLGKLSGCSRETAGAILHQFAENGSLILQGHRLLMPQTALPTAATNTAKS